MNPDSFLARGLRNRSFVVGGLLTLALIALAALSLAWTPHDPLKIVIPKRFAPPSRCARPPGPLRPGSG